MKKSITLKNYVVDGIEGTFTYKMKLVSDYIIEIDLDGRKTKYMMDDAMYGITKEIAEEIAAKDMACEIEWEIMKK